MSRYWEEGPRSNFKRATEQIKKDSQVETMHLAYYEEAVVLEGTFTLAHLRKLARALSLYQKEIADAKAYMQKQREG